MSRNHPVYAGFVSALLTTLLLGCPEPGQVTDEFAPLGPGNSDMLWIIDNSASMDDAQAQLMNNFASFGNGLPDGSTTQMGVTTTQAWPCTEDNTSEGCDDRFGTTGVIQRDGNDPILLDPASAEDRERLREMVDVGVYGAQKERPLQVALMAACEASVLPATSDFVIGVDDLKLDFPAGCTGGEWDSDHPLYESCHCLPTQVDQDVYGTVYPTGLHNANAGLLRVGTPLHVVVLTDEGDDTCTMWNLLDTPSCKSGGDDCSCAHAEMLRLLRVVVPGVRVTVVGPGQGPDADEAARYECNPQENQTCPLDFHFWSVAETDGMFVPLHDLDDSGDCATGHFASAMTDLLLTHPSTEWLTLSAVNPNPSTIEILLNGEPVPELVEGASCTAVEGAEGGFSYESDRNAVALFGDCAAYPPDRVEVTYTTIEVVQD